MAVSGGLGYYPLDGYCRSRLPHVHPRPPLGSDPAIAPPSLEVPEQHEHPLRWPVVCHQQTGLWLHQISMVHLNMPQPPKLADRKGHQTSSHEHPQKLGPPLGFLVLHWDQPMAQTHYRALWRKSNWKLDRNWRRGILKEREEATL